MTLYARRAQRRMKGVDGWGFWLLCGACGERLAWAREVRVKDQVVHTLQFPTGWHKGADGVWVHCHTAPAVDDRTRKHMGQLVNSLPVELACPKVACGQRQVIDSDQVGLNVQVLEGNRAPWRRFSGPSARSARL